MFASAFPSYGFVKFSVGFIGCLSYSASLLSSIGVCRILRYGEGWCEGWLQRSPFIPNPLSLRQFQQSDVKVGGQLSSGNLGRGGEGWVGLPIPLPVHILMLNTVLTLTNFSTHLNVWPPSNDREWMLPKHSVDSRGAVLPHNGVGRILPWRGQNVCVTTRGTIRTVRLRSV